jgi:hypothetical protein
MANWLAHVQAHWLLGLLTGEREYPSETMRASIATEKAFKRGRYPSFPISGTSIEAFMKHYHESIPMCTALTTFFRSCPKQWKRAMPNSKLNHCFIFLRMPHVCTEFFF